MVLRTPSTRLERRRLLDRAWQRYVVDGISPDALAADILDSWRRAREAYRIDPALRQPRLVLAPEVLEARRREDDALALAAPILQDFGGRLGLSGHVLAWFDGEGLMLALGGDERVVEAAGEDDFRPGASWAEASAGTNGPGTALAERKAVEVFASEHFVAAWQKWSCAAVPVFAPGREEPVGVVDITGPWEIRRRQALLVARGIATAVEERLRAAQGVRDEVVRYAFRAAQRSGEALVAVDGRGRLVAANDLAARRRLVEGGALPVAAREGLAAALRGAGGEIRVEPPGLPALVATPVEFQGRPVGAIVRVEAPGAARAPGLRWHAAGRHDLGRILGRSAPLRRAVELARSAAGREAPVLLHGEPGTGKELFARAIHADSARRGGPFVAVSCRAIPAARVEAELFGYEAGTFGGARRQGSPGKLELADGGTLFLDEASELSPAAQAALRRVLQEREVVRLGGSAPRSVDVRLVAATREPIEAEIAAGRLRRDLLRGADVVSIPIPPLRERGDDVELLAMVFLAEAESALNRRGLVLSAEALAALRRHPWPGNVRELRNVIVRAAAIAERSELSCADLLLELSAPVACNAAPAGAPRPAPAVASPPASATPRTPAAGPRDRTAAPADAMLRVAVRQSEREVLLAALDACGWNYARAARRLRVSRMTLYRRLARCGISRTGGA